MNSTNGAKPRAKALQTILYGGLIGGVLDGLDAVIFYKLVSAVPAALLFQFIASGLLGKRSFEMGAATVALGIVLQLFIAVGAAFFYWLVSLAIPDLVRRPFVYGPLFGIGLFFFMQHVVLPLARAEHRTKPMAIGELIDQLLSHAILVGLPIALMAHRSAKNP
jgi:hypothetical protein